MRTLDADVIVVGAGPSGLMVASELALAGVGVVVIEKREAAAFPRAGVLQPRVMEIFDSRGLADRLLARAHELHRDPKAPSGIWAGFPGVRYDLLDSPFPYILLLAQGEVEAVLSQRCLELGAEIRRAVEFTGLADKGDHVEIEVRAQGTPARMRARYLVGADGGQSAVRKAAGIAFVGEEATRTAVNIDARLDFPHAAPVTVTHNINGWGLSYPLKDGVTRFGVIDAEESLQPRNAPVTLDTAKRILARVFGSDFGVQELVWTSRFHNALFLAERLRDGRVFLVGEAVRIHYPASGVGMNFCLQDAFNLGWKLAAAVQSWAPEGLLDSYEAERLPTIVALLNDVRRQCAIQFNYSQDMLALKHMIERELLPLPDVNRLVRDNLAGLSACYPGTGQSHPLLGRRLPNVALRLAGGTALTVHEALRAQRFMEIGFGSAAEPRPQEDASRPLVRIGAEPSDHPDLSGIRCLLLRPDGHVAHVERQKSRIPDGILRQWMKDRLPVASTLRPRDAA